MKLENQDKQPIIISLNDGESVGDGGEGARGGCPLANALGDGAQHLLQPVHVSFSFGS